MKVRAAASHRSAKSCGTESALVLVRRSYVSSVSSPSSASSRCQMSPTSGANADARRILEPAREIGELPLQPRPDVSHEFCRRRHRSWLAWFCRVVRDDPPRLQAAAFLVERHGEHGREGLDGSRRAVRDQQIKGARKRRRRDPVFDGRIGVGGRQAIDRPGRAAQSSTPRSRRHRREGRPGGRPPPT